ncbi:hypothetical protein Glove_166g108 [Diversispora epigaea]|uniref:Uncharacterized protein n=1 Tax=Diversispora epigaea TaxID=1348612 RepID=A0A397IQL5_9GLOM|nr:hypothetical protein Glove_166g108 [Diversispora epigaea]
MVREESGTKISYDTNNKTQPMPNYENCLDYHNSGYNESDSYPYYYTYKPNGQISLNAGILNYFFEIYVDDETFDSLNQSSPIIMQAFDIVQGLRREELDGLFFSLLGFSTKYETYNYIESDLQVEKEQRTRTILEVLANIAALYGVTFSIYVLLFGERATKPLLEKFMASDDPPDNLKV